MPDPFLVPPANHKVHRARQPIAPPGAYRTWTARTWWRQATCEEVDCGQWAEGWVTAVDEATDLGQRQADYIRYHAGRRYTETRTEAGWTAFQFGPGQTCFAAAEHRVPAEREPLYLVQGGDWRQATGKARVYDRGDQFADDLHAHTDQITTARS